MADDPLGPRERYRFATQEERREGKPVHPGWDAAPGAAAWLYPNEAARSVVTDATEVP